MSVDKNYSEQFEKYLKGKMSPEEAHAFERDVLNDAFAQEALEGFEGAGIDAIDDLKNLQSQISTKTRKSTPWMRIAAAVALLIVGSYSIFYFTSEIESDQMAMEEESIEEATQTSLAPDTISLPTDTKETQIEEQPQLSEVTDEEREDEFFEAEDDSEEKPLAQANTEQKRDKLEITDEKSDAIAEVIELDPIKPAEPDVEDLSFEEELQGRTAGVQVSQSEEVVSNYLLDTTQLDEVVITAAPLVAETKSLSGAVQTISAEDVSKKAKRETGAALRSTSSGSAVQGIVTDDTGEPLPGVNVVIKGTTTGVTTDLDGRFVLPNALNETLVISYVGFEAQEIAVGSRTYIDVAMGGATELQEVVITGYGTSQEAGSSYSSARPTIGNRAFKQYLEENLNYPEGAKANNVEGTVVLELAIDDNGQVSNIDVKKSLGYGCDKEAIRLINEGPEWIAAEKDGKAVDDKLRVRVKFKLDR